MSCQATEVQPPDYDTIYSGAPSSGPMLDVPVTTVLHNVNLPPPAYEETPTWNVPSVAPQWSLAAPMPPNPNSASPYTKTFLRGYSKALGIFIIFAAIVEIALGIGLPFTVPTITFPSGILFWAPLFYITAGALAIAAQRNPCIRLIRGSLTFNIISSIFSATALVLNSIDVAILDCAYSGGAHGSVFESEESWHDDDGHRNQHHHHEESDYPQRSCQQQMAAAYGILSVLLLTNFVLALVTLCASISGCRSLSKVQSTAPQVFLKQNDAVMSMNPIELPAYQPPQSPPPYTATEVKAVPIHF